MTQFIIVNASTRAIQGAMGMPDAPDLTGPVPIAPAAPEGIAYYPWQEPLVFGEPPTPTSVFEWHDRPMWVERAPLADFVIYIIGLMDVASERARTAVIDDPTKLPEYQRAESQAQAYADADYEGDPPPCVASWAAAKRWTNGGVAWTGRQAADDILVTAALWYAALEGIRRVRLDAKERVRAIGESPDGTVEQVAEVFDEFRAALAGVMSPA